MISSDDFLAKEEGESLVVKKGFYEEASSVDTDR